MKEPDVPDEPFAITSPEEARARQGGDGPLDRAARYLRARDTVEAVMDAQFRGDSFRVGFAGPPLGGTNAWVEEDMVPEICAAAEAAGWLVSIDGQFLIFTARPEGT